MSKYISPKLTSKPHGIGFYMKGPYQAAYYNFKVSTAASKDNNVQKIASSTLKKKKETTSKKMGNFFKHIGVGTLLSIPLLNIFLFIILAKKNKTNSPMVKKPQTAYQVRREKELKAPDSKVLDGKRNRDFSFKESYQQTAKITQLFFHYFPEETKESQFIPLKKKKGEEDLAPLYNDIKFVEDLTIAEGINAEERFRKANANFPAFINFLDQKFPHLKGEFYLIANYKNEFKDKAKNIPYIEIIKALFLFENEEFISLMQSYDYVERTGPKDERTPIQINKKG